MINIIDSKKEAKKYTDAAAELFRIHRNLGEINVDETVKREFNKILKQIEEDTLYCDEPIKKEIVRRRFLSGESFMTISDKMNYSLTYIYALHSSIIKDFAMLIFRVIIL